MDVDADVEADIVRFKDRTLNSTFFRLLVQCAGAASLAVGAIGFPERSVEVDFSKREVRITPGPLLGMAFLGASAVQRWEFARLSEARYLYRPGNTERPPVRGIDVRTADGRPFRLAHTTNTRRYPKLERLAERLHTAITTTAGA